MNIDPVERLHHFEEILDPSSSAPNVDLSFLRSLCALGPLPPDPEWIRPKIWRLLLGTLPPEKHLWESHSNEARRHYYTLTQRFLEDMEKSPPPDMPPRGNDALLESIAKDVWRVQPTTFFASPSFAPRPEGSEIPELTSADALANRLRLIRTTGTHTPVLVPPEITLSVADSTPPTSPVKSSSRRLPTNKQTSLDLTSSSSSAAPFPHRQALLRILYVHSLLHPDQPYNQALPSILSIIYFVFAVEEVDEESIAFAEADAFFAFGEMMRDVAPLVEVSDIGGSLAPEEDGVRRLLRDLSNRLKWADEEYWGDLNAKSLNPELPYYSYRWVACLLSVSLPLHDVLQLWDVILAQPPSTPDLNPKLSFLIDLCTSMLLRLRTRLIVAGNRYKGGLWGAEPTPEDPALVPLNSTGAGIMGEGFVDGMKLLQNYPTFIGVQSILEGAWWLVAKERRENEEKERARIARETPGVFARMRTAAWRGMTNDIDSNPPPSPLASPVGSDHNELPLAQPIKEAPPASARLRQYLGSSDAAATLSKARSNWTAAAIDAWSKPQSGSSVTSPPSVPPSPTASITSSKNGWSVGSLQNVKGWVWGGKPATPTSPPPTSYPSERPSPRSRPTSTGSLGSIDLPFSPPHGPLSASLTPRRDGMFSPSSAHESDSPRGSLGSPTGFVRAQSQLLGGASSDQRRGGPRPLILSTHRVTRPVTPLSRQSSISSTSSRVQNEPHLSESDAASSSRVVPLRGGVRRRIATEGTSPSRPTHQSQMSQSRSPTSPLRSSESTPFPPARSGNTKSKPTPLDTASLTTPSLTNGSKESPPLPISPDTLSTMPHDEHGDGENPITPSPSDLTHKNSTGTVKGSRLRSKRSVPYLQPVGDVGPLSSHGRSSSQSSLDSVGDAGSTTGRGPLTPRPSPGQGLFSASSDITTAAGGGSLQRRARSPKPPSERRKSVSKTAPVVPTNVAEVPVMMSEEEGAKGDDEDDMDDLISAYSTEADPDS